MSPITVPNADVPAALAPADQHRLLAGAPWRRLVVLGDSIAEGIGDPVPGYPDRPWADQLAAALDVVNPGVLYRNLGVRGLKSDEILFDQMPKAMRFGPDLAVVSAGGNDILGRRFDSTRTARRLDALIGSLADVGARVVTFSLFDLSATPFVPDEMKAGLRERLEELAWITEQTSQVYGGAHVDFLDDPRTADPAIYSADRLHANRRGHALVLSGMVHALAAAIDQRTEEADRVVAGVS
jgi:lysophospholipase L1-like esterase